MNRLDVVIPEDLANAIQAEANSCVDDRRASLALEAEGVTCSKFTPEPTDNKYPFESRYPLGGDLTSKATRDHSEDRIKLGDEFTSTVVDTPRKVEISKIDSADADETRNYSEDRTESGDELNSQLVERLYKDAIESHDQKVGAGGVLANATSADVDLPLNGAVQPCHLSPELLSVSVPAAPNISYQRSLPTPPPDPFLKGFLRDANPGLSPWPCCSVPRSVCPAAPNYAEKPDFARRLRPYIGI